MDAITALAEQFNTPVIEDAAQAIGAQWKNQRAGSVGSAAAFSFYPTKNLSAYGDAGMVTTRDPEWAERMRQLRNHGSPQRYVHEELGWNCRMDAIQAAVLRAKLPYIEEWNQKRRERAAAYDRLFGQAGWYSLELSFQRIARQSCYLTYLPRPTMSFINMFCVRTP